MSTDGVTQSLFPCSIFVTLPLFLFLSFFFFPTHLPTLPLFRMSTTPLAALQHLPGSNTQRLIYPEFSFNFRWPVVTPNNAVSNSTYQSTYGCALGNFTCTVEQKVKSFYLQVTFHNVRMACGFAQNCEILSLDKKRLESIKGSCDPYYSRLIFSKYVPPLRLINETNILF